MEKLVELLNEYEKEVVVHWYEWYWQDVLMCKYIKDNFEFYTDEAATIAISKYYWFIERLVKKNKIDTKKVAERREEDWRSIVNYNHYEEQMTRDIRIEYWVDNTLMALSISDTPIDFLCDIIKN